MRGLVVLGTTALLLVGISAAAYGADGTSGFSSSGGFDSGGGLRPATIGNPPIPPPQKYETPTSAVLIPKLLTPSPKLSDLTTGKVQRPMFGLLKNGKKFAWEKQSRKDPLYAEEDDLQNAVAALMRGEDVPQLTLEWRYQRWELIWRGSIITVKFYANEDTDVGIGIPAGIKDAKDLQDLQTKALSNFYQILVEQRKNAPKGTKPSTTSGLKPSAAPVASWRLIPESPSSALLVPALDSSGLSGNGLGLLDLTQQRVKQPMFGLLKNGKKIAWKAQDKKDPEYAEEDELQGLVEQLMKGHDVPALELAWVGNTEWKLLWKGSVITIKLYANDEVDAAFGAPAPVRNLEDEKDLHDKMMNNFHKILVEGRQLAKTLSALPAAPTADSAKDDLLKFVQSLDAPVAEKLQKSLKNLTFTDERDLYKKMLQNLYQIMAEKTAAK